MPDVEVRKRVTIVEEIFHEGGPIAGKPLKRGAALAVIRNPFAGRYVEDIAPFMKDLEPLGVAMARDLVAALGGDPKAVEGYGKGAIVGAAGELEHGALWHVPGGYAMRAILGDAKAIVPVDQEGRRSRRAARRSDNPHQRILRAQPFRRFRGRRRRRAARRRDGVRAGHDDRAARSCARRRTEGFRDQGRGRTAMSLDIRKIVTVVDETLFGDGTPGLAARAARRRDRRRSPILSPAAMSRTLRR